MITIGILFRFLEDSLFRQVLSNLYQKLVCTDTKGHQNRPNCTCYLVTILKALNSLKRLRENLASLVTNQGNDNSDFRFHWFQTWINFILTYNLWICSCDSWLKDTIRLTSQVTKCEIQKYLTNFDNFLLFKLESSAQPDWAQLRAGLLSLNLDS